MAYTDVILNYKNLLIETFKYYIPKGIFSLIILVIGWFLIKIIKNILVKYLYKSKIDKSLKGFIQNMVGTLLWIILIAIILVGLGVNLSALLAGLGVAGFIVGFALQDTLGNLAAGVFILFHKPFGVDDWVNVNGVSGSVEKIGIAACTLKSADGVKITMPNSKVWGNTIQNYTANPIRTIFNLDVGISYSDDIEKAIKIVEQILKKDKRILKDPKPSIVTSGLGDSAVKLSIRPSVKNEDYWDVYFDMIKAIKNAFDKNGISIPFPQMEVSIKENKTKKKR